VPGADQPIETAQPAGTDQPAGTAKAIRWLAAVRDRLRSIPPGPAALLVATLALSAPRSTEFLPSTGVDAGWITGLNLARGQHLRFGRELVFTYGPWGFLDYPLAFSPLDLALGAVFAVLAIGWCWLALWAVLRAVLSPNQAALAASAVITLCAGASAPSGFLAVAVVLTLLHHVGRAAVVPPPSWSPAVTAAASALLLQVKFSEGLLATAATGCALVVAPAPSRGRRVRRCAEGAGAFLLATLAGWLLMDQRPEDFPYWIWHSLQIAAGYTDAMSIEAKPNLLPYLELAAVLGTVVGYLVALRRRRPRGWWCVLLVAAVALYVGVREGTGRHGAGQTGLGFLYMLPVLAWFVPVGRRPAGRLAVLAAFTLVIGHAWLPMTPQEAQARWGVRLQLLVDPTYRQQQLAVARQAAQRSYGLSASMRAAVGDRPALVDPFEVTAVWAYRLRWHPAPVLQDYSAYTAGLDSADAAFVANAPPDQQLLRRAGRLSLDGRYVLWDSPRYVQAEVCHYRLRQADSGWLLLAKAADRCGPGQQLGSTRVRAGQAVAVPPGDGRSLVVMSFTPAEPNVAVRLGRLLGKSFHPLHVRADGSYFRLPRALATGPLIVGLPAAAGWPAAFGGGHTFGRVSFTDPGTVRFTLVPLR